MELWINPKTSRALDVQVGNRELSEKAKRIRRKQATTVNCLNASWWKAETKGYQSRTGPTVLFSTMRKTVKNTLESLPLKSRFGVYSGHPFPGWVPGQTSALGEYIQLYFRIVLWLCCLMWVGLIGSVNQLFCLRCFLIIRLLNRELFPIPSNLRMLRQSGLNSNLEWLAKSS